MAKKKKYAAATAVRKRSVRHKTTARRKKRSGLNDNGLTKSPVINAAIGGAVTLLALWGINKLPINDIETKTGKGLDEPMTKKALATVVGVGAGFMLKSKSMMIGAGITGSTIIVLDKFKDVLNDNGSINGEAYIQYIPEMQARNLLNDENPIMYLSDPNTGQTYGVSDDGKVFDLSEGYGYTQQ